MDTMSGASPEWNPVVGAISMVLYLVILVFYIIVAWRIFVKAGKPGWAVLVPFYNVVVMLEIVNRPVWWLVLYFIPLVNTVIGIIVILDLAKSFGKSTGFAVGLILLSFIFFPILAFGDATYTPLSRPEPV